MVTIRSAWLAVMLALLSLHTGCGREEPVVPGPAVDGGSRADGGTVPDGGATTSVDADGDGHPAIADCDDTSAAVWRGTTAYADTDGDGRGAGALKIVCIGLNLPPGYSQTNDDCAPEDAWRWREATGLHIDADGDGTTVGGPVTACIGDPPVGYQFYASLEEDCDDTRPDLAAWALVYADSDRDGVGAGEGMKQCNDTPAPGYSLTATDCAPDDSGRWQLLSYFHLDGDGDGYTVPGSGQVCGGTQLPPGHALVSRGPDCDDTTATRWARISAYVDTDGDGFGTGDAVEQCTGGSPEPGYALQSLDCAPNDGTRWQQLAYSYRDQDLDGTTVSASGQVCSGAALPPGYSRLASGEDCDDTNATVNKSWLLYPDTDRDGVGHGSAETVCAGSQLPAGYSSTDTDCAPEESSRWRVLTYQYRDTDGDGFTTVSSGQVCSGTALPSGYATSSNGADCDDTNPAIHHELSLYPDPDGDGVGSGSSQLLCTDGSVPPSWSTTWWDCAPDDAARWISQYYSFRDADGDGHTVRSSGGICTGATLPPGYLVKASGNDCDDANATLFRWAVLYPDNDGDGAGAPPRTTQCIGQPIPVGYSIYGDDVNDGDPSQLVDAEQEELDALILEL